MTLPKDPRPRVTLYNIKINGKRLSIDEMYRVAHAYRLDSVAEFVRDNYVVNSNYAARMIALRVLRLMDEEDLTESEVLTFLEVDERLIRPRRKPR
jgi:hypothetical protein